MKERAIVPGVRDSIPPQGRVTVQLANADTGKVVHEVKAENAIMDWYLASATGWSRGDYNNDNRRYSQPNLSPISASTDTLLARDLIQSRFNVAGQYPGLYSPGPQMCWIWGSSANISPVSTHTHFPGSDTEGMLTGFARVDVAYTPNGSNLPRGTVVSSESRQTWTESRMVIEFSTTQGNGVYRSIGVGSVANRNLQYGGGGASHQANLWDPADARSASDTALSAVHSIPIGTGAIRSVTWPDHRIFWTADDTNIFLQDLSTQTTVTTGPSSATIGGSGRISVAAHGGKLWVGRGTTLKRCDYPTDTTLNVLNNYAPVTGFTDGAILDITSDGTNIYALGSTKVFVINPATGAVTSSWVHSLPRTVTTTEITNIEWDPAMQLLWLTIEPNGATGIYYPWGPASALLNSGSGQSNYNYSRSYGYTSTGTRVNYALPLVTPHNIYELSTQATTILGAWDGSSMSRMFTGMTGIAQQHGWMSWHGGESTSGLGSGNRSNFLKGPSMASHALLPSDVTKTGANTLKIIYDFDFS
jgi:hypothetical protein